MNSIKKEKKNWQVYILECSDNTLYVGITTQLEQRLKEHNTSKKGAKYTQGRRPVSIVFSKQYNSRSEALKEEYRLKQLPKSKKLAIINGTQ